jgi:anti-sigma factor RsiW
MTCRKVRNLMALAAGGDLRPRQAAAFRAHLDQCPACREELEGFRAALAGIKAAATAASFPDWSDGEWKALMARAAAGTRGAGEERGRAGGYVFRPRWAAASVLGAAIGLAILSVLFRGPSPQPGTTPGGRGMVIASENPRQDRVSVTLVSPESGLHVIWFLDKNFDYKGEQE